jgi:hypothetical protein
MLEANTQMFGGSLGALPLRYLTPPSPVSRVPYAFAVVDLSAVNAVT